MKSATYGFVCGVVLLSVVLTGCAVPTREKYEAIIETWRGATEDQLVSSWGPPDSVYERPGGTRWLTYSKSRTVVSPGTSPSYIVNLNTIGSTTYGTATPIGGLPTTVETRSCKITFIVAGNNRIGHWFYEGNDCVAY